MAADPRLVTPGAGSALARALDRLTVRPADEAEHTLELLTLQRDLAVAAGGAVVELLSDGSAAVIATVGAEGSQQRHDWTWLTGQAPWLTAVWHAREVRIQPLRALGLIGAAPDAQACAVPWHRPDARACLSVIVVEAARPALLGLIAERLELSARLPLAFGVGAPAAETASYATLARGLEILQRDGSAAAARFLAQTWASEFQFAHCYLASLDGARVCGVDSADGPLPPGQLRAVVADAVGEAVDQRADLIYPAPDDAAHYLRATRALAEFCGAGGVIIARADAIEPQAVIVGIVARTGVDRDTVARVNETARLLGRLWPARPKRGFARWMASSRLRNLRSRRVLAIAAALLVVTAFLRMPHRVDAQAQVAAIERQIVTAGVDGVIIASAVQPGDRVVGGETVLAQLRTDELDAAIDALEAEAHAAAAAADGARAAADPVRARIAQLQSERARYEREVMQIRNARTTLTAPSSGIVAAGDLRQRLGGAVTRGEVLFEIVAPDRLRIEIEVEDRDVLDVQPGQSAVLRLGAEPGRERELTVATVVPSAHQGPGGHRFLVLAEFREGAATTGLLPGMRGQVAITTTREYWWRLAWRSLRRAWSRLFD